MALYEGCLDLDDGQHFGAKGKHRYIRKLVSKAMLQTIATETAIKAGFPGDLQVYNDVGDLVETIRINLP